MKGKRDIRLEGGTDIIKKKKFFYNKNDVVWPFHYHSGRLSFFLLYLLSNRNFERDCLVYLKSPNKTRQKTTGS